MWIRVDKGRELLNMKYLKSIKIVGRNGKCTVYAIQEKESPSDDSFFHEIASEIEYSEALMIVDEIQASLGDECSSYE